MPAGNLSPTNGQLNEVDKDAAIYVRVAQALEERNSANIRLPRIIRSLLNRVLEFIVTQKISRGLLETSDLHSNNLLLTAEKRLEELYPGLDLKRNPANPLLYSRFARETREAIEALYWNTNAPVEPGPVSSEELEDPDRFAEVHLMLSKLYPDLDLSGDPGQELLEGRYKDEVERAINQLASPDIPRETSQGILMS